MATSNSDIVRAVFRAYLDQDRETAEYLTVRDGQVAEIQVFFGGTVRPD